METPRYEAEGVVAEVVTTTAVVLVVGYLLWPPGYVYWDGLVDRLGAVATLAVVAGLAAGVGAWFARTSAIALRHLLAGGVVAYVAGMAAIEAVIAPASPVHLVWYAVLLVALLGGGLAWRVFERFGRSRRAR